MLGVTVADPDAIALIALIVASAASLPAWLNWHARRRQGRQIDQVAEYVRPNGTGQTLPELGEQILARVEAIESRVTAAEREFGALRGSVASVTTQVIDHDIHDERRFSDAAQRMGRLSEQVSDLDRDMYEMAREMAQVTVRMANLDDTGGNA